MDLDTLIRDLSSPDAWPGRPPVDVVQTHISVVFLVGDRVYKLKKPVNLGFLDFSTFEARRADAEAEVALNRRLAPNVYLGTVDVVLRDGVVRVGGPGEVVDTAVEMVRLPDDARLVALLAKDAVEPARVEAIARRLAAFHASARRGPDVARYGRYDVVAGNALDNFAQSRAHVGVTVTAELHARLERATSDALAALKPTIDARADRGVPCDTHGDLHLDHVYVFPDRAPPDDLLFLDCLEFADRFRFADPVADVAFLAMDLGFSGRDDLAAALVDAWIAASGDAEARRLFPFYRSYRAAVRAKVGGMKALGREIAADDRARAVAKAAAHWRWALSELLPGRERPAIVGVGGLPGTGKSTLARGLAARLGFEVIRADVVRKDLIGISPTERAPASAYDAATTERTYAECLRRAEDVAGAGGRALIDATLRTEAHRRAILDGARRLGVRAALLVCDAPADVVKQRLAARTGDASDADWEVYTHTRWEAPSRATERRLATVRTGGSVDDEVDAAVNALEGFGVA